MFEYERKNNSICITRYNDSQPQVEVPEEIDGMSVSEIGDYAFAKTEITHLTLPPSIRRLGRYALYNCSHLTEFSFPGSIRDIGAGAFTGCHHIQKLCVTIDKDRPSCLREILMEVPEELSVEYICPEGTASLIFPEFFEESIENTPARIISIQTHGSGIQFRNCFLHKKFQFAEYDKFFSFAIVQERFEFLIQLVLKRLRYPLCLSEQAKNDYTAYLNDHFDEAIAYFTKKQELETVSYLMNFRHQHIAPETLDFEL